MTPNSAEITYGKSMTCIYIGNVCVEAKVTVKDSTYIANTVRWGYIIVKKFNGKVVREFVSLLFCANNYKLCFYLTLA